jgi:hypothetical protein
MLFPRSNQLIGLQLTNGELFDNRKLHYVLTVLSRRLCIDLFYTYNCAASNAVVLMEYGGCHDGRDCRLQTAFHMPISFRLYLYAGTFS